MEIPAGLILSVTPVYITLLALLWLPFTMRAAFYRIKTKILIGDGGDPEMLRRMRAHANFIESVPLALLLLVAMEVWGAANGWLHGLGVLLVFGRITHYLGLSEMGPSVLRVVGQFSTFTVYLLGCGWMLVAMLR
jgi:uncharacterized membrane protein YecN with MAPEG domain